MTIYFRIATCFLLLQVLSQYNTTYGQTDYLPPTSYTPPTPAATQFEKYINYPVNHNTGAVSIDIPLYTIKAGSIEVPITLSYHASGVKPGDPSIPVGLGWVINPGARVTRKVLSYPDEHFPKAPYQSNYHPVNDLQALQNMEYSPGSFWSTSNRNAILDAESDVFTYYTPTGTQGRFIIERQGDGFIATPLLLTKDRITIHSSSVGIDYIEVIDANGTLYRFGTGISDYSSNPNSVSREAIQQPDWRTVGWALTDIISADKADTVSFIWKSLSNETTGLYRKSIFLDNIIVTDKLSPWNGGSTYEDYVPWGYTNINLGGPSVTTTEHMMTAIWGIKYKNKEVKMVYTNNSPTLLTSVDIYSGGLRQREIEIQINQFANGYKRLDGVVFRDRNSQVINNYGFGYNEQIQLPDQYNRGLDFWGYYNGYESNQTLVPNFPYYVDKSSFPEGGVVYTINTNSNRSSNDNVTAYILNRVTYPTGGKTTYEYEVNRMADATVLNGTPTGGCRVKKISHWTTEGQLAETRKYVYGIGECGYGEGVNMLANMYVDETQTWVKKSQGEYPIRTFHFTKRFISHSPVNPMFMSDLPPVSYEEITEYVEDNLGNNTGKIVYNYSPTSLPNSTYFQYSQYTYSDNYYKKPVLLSTTYYKNNSGNYTVVKKDATEYIEYEAGVVNQWTVQRLAYIMTDLGNVDPKLLETEFYGMFSGALPSVFRYFPVYLHRGIKVPVTQRSIVYANSGESIETEKVFGYTNNDYLYPETLTTKNSNGSTTITHFRYPKDYVDIGDDDDPTNSVAKGIKLLKERNVTAVIEEYTKVQPGNVIKSGKYTTYKPDKPLPENIYSLNVISSAGNFNPATITPSSDSKSSSYRLRNTVDLYDSYGNIRQITDKVAGISTVILYSYGAKLPIAIIKNATYANILAYRTETAINDFAVGYPTDAEVNDFVLNLRSSLPQAFITTYTHDDFLGITSQTDENGRTIHYQYDRAGRLQLIKDKDNNVVKTFEYKYKQ